MSFSVQNSLEEWILGMWKAVWEGVIKNVQLSVWPALPTQRPAGRSWKLMDHSDTVMAKWTPPAFTSVASVTCVFMEVSSLHRVTLWQSIQLSAFPTGLHSMPGGVLDSAVSVNVLPALLCRGIILISFTIVTVLFGDQHHCTPNEIWRVCSLWKHARYFIFKKIGDVLYTNQACMCILCVFVYL